MDAGPIVAAALHTTTYPGAVRPDTSPFMLAGSRNGCLLIHGLTGAPRQLYFLGGHLHASGYTVHGMRVAGHSGLLAELERSTWQEWYASARTALGTLRTHSPRVVIIGQSMGALLALLLAADYPDVVAGVVLLAPALTLAPHWLRWLRPILPLVIRCGGKRLRYLPERESDIADPRARAEPPTYERAPTRGVYQLLLLQAHVRSQLSRPHQPAFIVHSRQDHTCPFSNVTQLQQALRGPVTTLELQDSYHVISVDVDKERVARAVVAFVDGIFRQH